MKNTVKLSLVLCASAIALTSAVGAQAQTALPGPLDGSYSLLPEVLEQLPVVQAELLEQLAEAKDAAEAAAAASAAVEAALSDEDKELRAAYVAADDAFNEAQLAVTEADEAVVLANEASDAALAARTEAQDVLVLAVNADTDAANDVVDAQEDADDAQADYTAKLADQSATPGEIAIALAARDDANDELDAANEAKAATAAALASAERAVVSADGLYVAATSAATAASTAAIDAVDAFNDADDLKSEALGDLQTSLAANTDLTAVFEDLDIDVAEAGGVVSAITNVDATAEALATSFAEAEAAIEALNLPAVLVGAQRLDTILTDAANSSQENIANASRALTEVVDPESLDLVSLTVNYETEVLAALTDHEDRITENASDIVAEAAARIAGDAATLTSANTFTTTSVAAEAALRVAGDVALGNRITAEETARVAADTALGSRITGETNARIASDLAINTRITQVDKALRDKIATSTATAIAMGGATILPDTNFTLAGNVGVYEGATALAINVAGRVSEKAYVTAAVGGGTNKGGKLGARVGVVFGF